MAGFTLPKELLLGTATAATQIEGGDVNCNWYYWSLAGRVGGGESSLPGAGHWDRVEEDVELMASLNLECYRMSVEWSRIEPRPGEWSSEGIAHYRGEFELLAAKGIKTLVTLHHFSCPQWFQERGGSRGASSRSTAT
jgi:beta-glucosidase